MTTWWAILSVLGLLWAIGVVRFLTRPDVDMTHGMGRSFRLILSGIALAALAASTWASRGGGP